MVKYQVDKKKRWQGKAHPLCFLGETDEDVTQDVSLIKEYEFPQVHISRFYPRPGMFSCLLLILRITVISLIGVVALFCISIYDNIFIMR